MVIASCNYCNDIQNADKINLFGDDETNKILEGIFNGSININNLSVQMYEKIATRLTDGVFKGFGKNLISTEFGSPDYKMLQSLRENVYVFSAAKTYQQTKEISSLLTNKEGKLSFSDFKKEAKTVFEKYNENYLNAEYNSAIAQARSASMWMDFEKDKSIYNQLEYLSAGDARVRIEHAALNGIIKPVDDKFWNIYMPPNGWNCRCTVLQARGEMETDLSKKTPPTKKEVPDIFRFNAGKEKIIFSKSHPYFEVPKKDVPLALKNFNLPLPSKSVQPVKGSFVPAKTVDEVVTRLKSLNVLEVDLKGLKPDMANAILEAVEKEHSFGGFGLNKIETFKKAGGSAKALYYDSTKTIKINTSKLKAENQVLVPYEKQIEDLHTTIERFKADYMGNYKYKQATVFSRIYSFKNRISDIEFKLSKGETPKYWTVSSTYSTSAESLKATMTHELGHYRHYKTLNLSTAFEFNKVKSITEYGMTNFKEYFTEWFTQYRLKGEKGVPEDLLTLFKKIDNGK